MIPDLFCAKKDKERGTVVLTSKFGKFTLVGSSNITSARAGDVISSLTIVPTKEFRGVVAVAVHDPGKGRCDGEWYAYLLEVSYRGDDPWVDLETPFVCDENRVGHVHHERFIEIVMDYQWYSSCPNTSTRKHIEVPDDDLLCCWIAGTIGDDEVIAAAKKYEAEQTELERLREQVKHSVPETVQFGLEMEIAILKEAKKGLEDNMKFWRGVAFALWAVLRKFGPLFRGFARKLCDSPRFKTTYEQGLSWMYPSQAFDRKEGQDWVETPLADSTTSVPATGNRFQVCARM